METEGFPVLVPDKNSSSVKSLFLLAFPGILKETDNHKKRGTCGLRQSGQYLLITQQCIASPMAY